MISEGKESISKEKSFLRWAGLAGILAGVFFIITILTLVEFGPSTTAAAPQLVNNFPNVRTGLAVGNGFYFSVSVSLVVSSWACIGLSVGQAGSRSSGPSYMF